MYNDKNALIAVSVQNALLVLTCRCLFGCLFRTETGKRKSSKPGGFSISVTQLSFKAEKSDWLQERNMKRGKLTITARLSDMRDVFRDRPA